MKVLMRLIPIGILALMPFLTLANGRQHDKPDERTLNTLKHLDTNSFNSSLKPKNSSPTQYWIKHLLTFMKRLKALSMQSVPLTMNVAGSIP